MEHIPTTTLMSLPSLLKQSFHRKKDFYSHLQEGEISDKDYAHAQKLWDVFHCNTFGEYHHLYVKTDVLLLADVFENFRNVCLTTYELDATHYYTAPGLSWDAMLKHAQVQLELIDDIDMYQMVEKGIRWRHFSHYT